MVLFDLMAAAVITAKAWRDRLLTYCFCIRNSASSEMLANCWSHSFWAHSSTTVSAFTLSLWGPFCCSFRCNKQPQQHQSADSAFHCANYMDSDAAASKWIPLLPRWPVLDPSPPKSNQVINRGKWLYLLSFVKTAQLFMRYCGNKICQDEWTNGRTRQTDSPKTQRPCQQCRVTKTKICNRIRANNL